MLQPSAYERRTGMLITAVKPRLLSSGPLLGQQLPRLEHQLPVRHRPALVPGEDGLDGVAEQAVGHALCRGRVPRGLVRLAAADQDAVVRQGHARRRAGVDLPDAARLLSRGQGGPAESFHPLPVVVSLRQLAALPPELACRHGLHEPLDLGARVVAEVAEQRRPDRAHADAVLPGALPEHLDERRERQRPAFYFTLAGAVMVT